MVKQVPISFGESTESVNRFLRIFGLASVKSGPGGGYVIQKISVPSLIFILLLLGTDIFCMVSYFSSIKNVFLLLIEVSASILQLSILVITLLIVNCTHESSIRNVLDNVAFVDATLAAEGSEVHHKKTAVNSMFFGILTVYLSISCVEIIMLHEVYSTEFLMSLPNFIFSLLMQTYFMGLNAKLYILKNRVKLLEFKISSLINDIKYKSNIVNKNSPEIEQIISCYLKIIDTSKFFNNHEGFPVFLTFLDMILSAIRNIHMCVSYLASSQTYPFLTPAILISNTGLCVSKMMTLMLMLVQVTSITNVSSNISLNIECAIEMNNFGTEQERTAWCDLAELLHRNPLQFTAYDFFNLDYSLLSTSFGTMVTYTVILSQMVR